MTAKLRNQIIIGILFAAALVVTILLSQALRSNPTALGGSSLIKQVEPAAKPSTKECPPTAKYGKGQKPGKGCQEKP